MLKDRYYKASAILALCILLALLLSVTSNSPTITTENSSNAFSKASPKEIPESISRLSNIATSNREFTPSEVTQNHILSVLKEIDTRLEITQTEEALNELNGLLDSFDSMSVAEKRDLLTAYATYFLKNSQNDDARFFYEQILTLPGLGYTNRLAILQMLARIAMASEDWDGFLAYNNQYFDEGGGYNWVVTGHLARAYQMLENYNAAGDAMLLHFETGIHPEYDGSNEQYQRRYARYEAIPLQMTNLESAVILAESMVEQFDQPGNWRVLAELYRSRGDDSRLNDTIEAAQEKNYIDSSGNWVD